ncbi:MAG: aldehyde dehydrogenase [Bdellovibrionaceae bacterium]|nr:aldehyde dehydrogenase [Pseudobdellovibrionaceae bacterium]
MSYTDIIHGQRRFFKSGKTRSIEFRIEQLRKLKSVIQIHEPKILQALFEDLRKPKFESYISEIGVLIEEIDFTIKNLEKWSTQKSVLTPVALFPAKGKIYAEPFGIVAVFAPWNYPVQLLLAPVVGAIAAGNCAILKPADLTSNTQSVLLNMINSNFDPGFLYAIGGGVAESEQLLKEKFDYIFFTGSARVGKIIMRAAAEHLTPICLELGGKSPCIVDQDADIQVAARRIVWAKFFNAGQTCVAPDYVCVHESIKTEFLTAMKECMDEFFGLHPENSDFFARIVSEKHLERLVNYLDKEIIFCGGEFNFKTRYLAPTILSSVAWDAPVMQEEIFGPIMPVIEFTQISDVIEQINSRPKPLALYYYSENTTKQNRMIAETSSGGMCINDCIVHLANPHLPFGGVGSSGMGSYHGHHSFNMLSHKKGVLINSTKLDIPLRYPPYTEKKFRWLRRFI